MASDDLFEKYVLTKGYVQPCEDMDEAILANPELLSAVAALWRNSKHVIEAVIKARIHPIQREIVQEAVPFEVPILRQAMVEVAYICDDFERYAREFERRKKDDTSVNGEASPPPVAQQDNAGDNGKEPSTM